LALTEYEKGRDRLLEIVSLPVPSDEEEFNDLPSPRHDLSDKTDPVSPLFNLDDESDMAALVDAGDVSTVMVGREKGVMTVMPVQVNCLLISFAGNDEASANSRVFRG
jgi:hypothetical protein